jgi:hypothetical protein
VANLIEAINGNDLADGAHVIYDDLSEHIQHQLDQHVVDVGGFIMKYLQVPSLITITICKFPLPHNDTHRR